MATAIPTPPSSTPFTAIGKIGRAAAHGLGSLADPSGPLEREPALAALRVVWNAGSDAEWDAAVVRARKADVAVADILLAADGAGLPEESDDAVLLDGVDTLCGRGASDRVRVRITKLLGEPAEAAFAALERDKPAASAATPDAPADSGWLQRSLVSAAAARDLG